MYKKKRRSYKFTEKKHSKKALVVWMLSVLTLAAYLFFIFLSYQAAGNLSAHYGGFGVMTMVAAIVILCVSFTTLNEEDSFQFFPRMAVMTSLLSAILWIGTYVGGFLKG